jgi:hypothetical protein
LEGRKEDCPNLLPDDLPDATAAQLSDAFGESGSTVRRYPPTEALYAGLPLEIAEARELSGRARAIVIALTGMAESGKTSLLARLHQMFQAGPVGGYDFAGSRTLPRFEELNWLATIESGVGSPTMEKSSRKYDNSFLHYTVRHHLDGCEPVDILLNDISGETYPEAIAAESVCEQLFCLRRADHLALVVDGEAIDDRNRRHDHCAKAQNFVQRVLQTGQLGKQTALHLIITKLDVLNREDHKAENDAAATRLEADFVAQFEPRVAKIHLWRLAARPLDCSRPTEETVAALFAIWVGTTYRYTNTDARRPAPVEHARDFCRFGM